MREFKIPSNYDLLTLYVDNDSMNAQHIVKYKF